ncbi:hypothetical protein [Ensifer sp. LC14]|uniref:hypothetical protein n=1 Tax=Ensifer sp. LC14 TaxID=1873714 RepID=UPI00192A577B|nr:hypothetical protein [Ensifer sp. LC14]
MPQFLLEVLASAIARHGSTRIQRLLQPVCEYQQTIRYIVEPRAAGAGGICCRVGRQHIVGVIACLLPRSHLRPSRQFVAISGLLVFTGTSLIGQALKPRGHGWWCQDRQNPNDARRSHRCLSETPVRDITLIDRKRSRYASKDSAKVAFLLPASAGIGTIRWRGWFGTESSKQK